jgi:micrococcal nuclease
LKKRKALSALTIVAGAGLWLGFLRNASVPSASGPFETLSGTVIFIYDGDTIKVRLDSGGERRVRLIGVDAPESDDPIEENRLSAFLALRFASSRLSQKRVRLILDKEKEDSYGRLLAFVQTDGETSFNEILVREGFASAYLKYPFDEGMKKRLRQAEAEARQAKRGLWREGPWPVIGPGDARSRLGQVATVRFRCLRTFRRGRYRVLTPDEGDFETVIPQDVVVTLPGPLDFEKRELEVTGLIEEFRGLPQIMVGVPSQLRFATVGR